jgi:membrane-bound lytic murein transglycosylase D
LRQSFEMADCDADPHILSWARRYTRSPQRFEQHIREVMPRLVYVQQVAASHGVAGEFALLPWVESHFQPVQSRHHQRAAGMWQIVPRTARSMGLKVGHDYDGRYDVPAATEGVMTLLSRYHDDMHDWRLVDYAYNAGEFAVRRLVRQHGAPGEHPVIPKLPVTRTTREHLTKLLAIACVVREPSRFHVDLPLLPPGKQLETVAVKHSMPLAQAARRADMPLGKLKHLNAAFRNGHIAAAGAPAHLLLPRRHAEHWRSAVLQSEDADLTASVTPQPLTLPTLSPDDGEPPQGDIENTPPIAPPSSARPSSRHTVRRGESLWTIARRYAVSVRDLEHWNHLHGHKLKPGQVLKISAPG